MPERLDGIGAALSRLRAILRDRLYTSPTTREDVIRQFHRLYYDSWHHLHKDTLRASWLGIKTLKCPMDLWTCQEILFETRPDVVVECGTYHGGSALYMANLLDLLGGDGRIVSIDTRHKEGLPSHSRLTYITGSSVSDECFEEVQDVAAGAERLMVCLDSDHSRDHVLKELELYSDLVTVGNYMIVEDTNVNGHPVYPDHGPGPMEAVIDFLASDDRFEIDRQRERFLLTMNPGGYLKRVR
jgi:cephalosporin hydroxylase